MAVTISVAVHGLIGLFLWTMPAIRSHSANDQPLNEIAVVVVPDEPASVALAADAASTSIPRSNSDGPDNSDSGPIRVGSLPVDSGSGSPEPDVPQVVNPARPGGAGADSTGAGSTFFGVQVTARSVVFVIDRSTSMWVNHGLEAAKRELLEKLARLPTGTRFQVLFYDQEVVSVGTTDRDGLHANIDESRRRVIGFIQSIKARGSTNHMTALRRALELRPEAILFITDAEDLTRNQVRSITDVNQGRTAIHALQWCPTHEPSESLQELARLNRGIYRQLGP
jgi:hypothetical protein